MAQAVGELGEVALEVGEVEHGKIWRSPDAISAPSGCGGAMDNHERKMEIAKSR
jgi:hypothetical protein